MGDIISHLKLQKLLYYCQGFYLAIYDKPLFPERIEHWAHGPVVPDVYHKYSHHGDSAIPMPDDLVTSEFTKEHKDIMADVYKYYGQYSAWALRDMTHKEPPWLNTAPNEEITKEQLSMYFKTQIQ